MKNLIVCIDPRRGMSFNKRRQTLDAGIMKHIVENLQRPLITTPYSLEHLNKAIACSSVAADLRIEITQDVNDAIERFEKVERASLFIELASSEEIERAIDAADMLTIYIWPSTYLATVKMPDVFSSDHWRIGGTSCIDGSSHKSVTRCILLRTY